MSALSNRTAESSAAGESSVSSARHAATQLDRLLSAPVTARDVELLIQRACRESYATLFDGDDFTRMAMPSTIERWAADDPRRDAPRTQEGEVVAAFLRYIVSPGYTEGALGRIVSKSNASGEYRYGGA